MYFVIEEEQKILEKLVRDIVEKEIKPIALEVDKSGEVPESLWKVLKQSGMTSLGVPTEYGGPGLKPWTLALLFETLAKGCAGIATACAANMLALLPVLFAGNEKQKKAFSELLLKGGMAAFALTEPAAGSDASAVATRAEKVESGYVLNGTKQFITNGPNADTVVVFAKTNKDKGIRGMSAFIVDAKTQGFSVGKIEDKMGIRASATSELIMQDCFIPDGNRIGKEGQGFLLAMMTLNASRPFVGAISVGIAQAALEEAIAYAHQREQFGAKLIALQMVQQLIADMAMQTEAARLLVWKATVYQEEGRKDAGIYASMAKCYASDVAMKVTTDAVQVLGGIGFSRESNVEKYMRDAKVMQIFEGSNQVQRTIIGNGIRYMS